MAVNNFAPAEFGGYVLGVNGSGGGGGGDVITPIEMYHVILNAPAYDGTFAIRYASVYDENYNEYLTYSWVDDNTLILDYVMSMASGLDNVEVNIAKFRETEEGYVISMSAIDNYHAVVTGDIAFNDDDGWQFTITGDGTISIVAD